MLLLLRNPAPLHPFGTCLSHIYLVSSVSNAMVFNLILAHALAFCPNSSVLHLTLSLFARPLQSQLAHELVR